jgi:hypothetical protein
MDLTLREGYKIKLCMKLIAVIFHDNYYNQFYGPSVKWYNNKTPSTDQGILLTSQFIRSNNV